jgi:Tol biopolymer transport system component
MGSAAAVVLVCLVTAVVLLVRRPSSRFIPGDGSQHFQIASNTQITTAQGLSFYPTFSPDGTSMAYSAERGKGFEIFVRQLQPGGQEVQITSDGGQNKQPAWSPDGKLIAFHSRQRGGIWLVPALGGTTRQVTEFGSHPAWSHDGQSLAFQGGALDDFSADSTGANPPSTLWVIRLDGSSPRPLTKREYPDGGHGSPSWSPDGKHIVFVASVYGGSWLWAVGSDGSGAVRLAERSSGYYDPVYSPDGKSVLYGAVAPGINYGLWQIRVSQDTSAPIGEPVEINNSGGTRIKNLAFSPDGKRLLYAAIGLTGSLASLPIGKSGEPSGEPVALTTDVGCRSILPAFSPDGSRIAFNSCRGRPGLPQQVWLMNADGSHNQQLTPGPRASSFPIWYPDGRRIFFRSDNKLFSIDPETRQQKLVMKLDRNFGSLRLSPDGTQFVTDLSTGGIFNLWLVDAVTGKAKQLTFDKDLCSYPVWSPDGKYIAAEVQHGEDIGIGIVPSTGGPLTQLTPYHGQQWNYSWSPDSDKIIYAKREDDSIWNVWSVSRSTKAEKRLTHYTKINAYVRYPAMSPRGNQIVYEYTETTGNIWMFEFK